MKKMIRKMKDQKGFTLIELLAVIVILGIIAAIAVPAVANIIGESKDDAYDATVQLVESAARIAHADGLTPQLDKDTSVSGVDSYSLNQLVENGYLEELPGNPYGEGKYSGSTNYVTYNDKNFTFNAHLE